MKLENKVALVTGGSSGIGRATGLACAREGARVVIADIDVTGGKETVSMITEEGGDALFIKADVSRHDDVDAMIQETVETYGQLDCAHNNAGKEGMPAPTADCTEENWDEIVKINLKGTFLCMKYEINQMLKQRKGAIVNTASSTSFIGAPGLPAYSAAKAGVVELSRTAAVEYAKMGIRVNTVCPGAIRTPMLERWIENNPSIEQMVISSHPVGRIGEPKEIADAVVFLCSDAASFITGHSLLVDGGQIIQ